MKILALFAIVLALVSMGCTQPQGGSNLPNGTPQDCAGTPGAIWCDSKQKCLLPYEEGCTPVLVGNDSDSHGCKPSAGYSWCEQKQKCLRVWEEACVGNRVVEMTEADAIRMATGSPECTGVGSLNGVPSRNSGTRTWWIDIAPTEPKAGCNPACVVSDDGTTEVNWRCTGAIPPQ